MNNIILIENKHNTEKQLLLKVNGNIELYKRLVNSLRSKGFLSCEDGEFVVEFVGLFIVDDLVVFFMPKFLKEENVTRDVCINIINLLRDYSSRESLKVEEVEYLGYDEGYNKNFLGVIDFILKDYLENGLYINSETIYKINSTGRIDWVKTIENNSLFFNDGGQPVYVELVTCQNNLDENLLITNIHKYIINKCFNILKDLSIIDIFNYNESYFEIDEYGFEDKAFVISNINKELNNQYIDRKVNLLKAMISFIDQSDNSAMDDFVLIYGTKYFHIVWEKVNSFVFNNQYEIYKKYIQKPNWKTTHNLIDNYKETLIPDILFLCEDLKFFFILDAKYYTMNFDSAGRIKGTIPGIADIVKQLAYEAAFTVRFEKKYSIYNAFIIPTTQETKITGSVSLELFDTKGEIFTLHINYNEVFNMYRNFKKYSRLFWINNIFLENESNLQMIAEKKEFFNSLY